jgi:hypothetical protein
MKPLATLLRVIRHLMPGRRREPPTPSPTPAPRQRGVTPGPLGTGSWVFVSHSNKDFQAVRSVRNALEERGHFPLLFFLKCVSDGTELESLLRREIEARDFFLLCESENARASRFVQEEVKFIRSLGNKIYETVDLDADWKDQLTKIDALSRRATVFLSYSSMDSGLAEQIASALEARDFRVLDLHHDRRPGGTWHADLEGQIREALDNGFVVILLSQSAVSQEESYQWREVHVAIHLAAGYGGDRTRVVPVVLNDYASVIRRSEQLGLSEFSALDLSAYEPADQASKLSDVLLQLAREAQ